jgi:capsular polysaccharide biosynthesis protein
MVNLAPQRESAESGRIAEICADRFYQAQPSRLYHVGPAYIDTDSGLITLEDGRAVVESMQVAKYYAAPNLLEGFDGSDQKPDWVGQAKVIRESVFHCLHRSTDAFGHFVCDGLAALSLSGRTAPTSTQKLLLPEFSKRWMKGRLAEIGIDDTRTIGVAGWVFCEDLVTTDLIDTRNTFRPNRETMSSIRDIIPARNNSGHRRIYLSRNNQRAWSQRFISNESDVEAALAAEGFDIVEPANMTLPEQAALFSDAKCVVGPHGSAFANLCFAGAGIDVFDLMPEGWVDFWPHGRPEKWLLNLTSALKQNYTLVLCRSETIGPRHYQGGQRSRIESTVDVPQLLSLLRKTVSA